MRFHGLREGDTERPHVRAREKQRRKRWTAKYGSGVVGVRRREECGAVELNRVT